MVVIIKIILGIIFTSWGLFLLILYLNLFTIGYNFKEFVYFIISSPYMYTLFIGVFLIIDSIERKKINEFLLRHNIRFFRKKL